MVTFKIVSPIARAETTICICFANGVVPAHHANQDYLEAG